MSSASVDELFDVYAVEIIDLLDVQAPRYIKKRPRRILTPWYEMDCRDKKRTTRRLEKKYRRTRLPSDRLILIDQLKKQSAFFRQKEQFYWLLRIKNNYVSPKKFWKDLDVFDA